MDSCKPSCRSSSFFCIISPHQRLKILKSWIELSQPLSLQQINQAQ
jgi:hypothetical protein